MWGSVILVEFMGEREGEREQKKRERERKSEEKFPINRFKQYIIMQPQWSKEPLFLQTKAKGWFNAITL